MVTSSREGGEGPRKEGKDGVGGRGWGGERGLKWRKYTFSFCELIKTNKNRKKSVAGVAPLFGCVPGTKRLPVPLLVRILGRGGGGV